MTPEQALDRADARYRELIAACDRGGSLEMYTELKEIDETELRLLLTVLIGRDFARACQHAAAMN